jgi:hypothetical protein
MRRPLTAMVIAAGLISTGLGLTSFISDSVAHSSRRGGPSSEVGVIPEGPEGVGCYWERGRQYCSRYCYVEIDGRRFCHERLRDAHSQAPVNDWRPTNGRTMK